MQRDIFCAVMTVAMTFVQAIPAVAEMTAAEEQERMSIAGGAWHAGAFVPCADGVVTLVEPRLEASGVSGAGRFGSGVAVEFKLPSAPAFLNGRPFATARVVHYDSELGNSVMEAEHPGDRVQVCLVSFPTPTHDLETGKVVCDPNVDTRGMVYRVYDYKRHRAYLGPDTEHSCGGA